MGNPKIGIAGASGRIFEAKSCSEPAAMVD
jgi:hypothetical protein